MNIEKPFYISKEKYKELKIELENLLTTGRSKIAQDLDEAKALGDLSENAEYHSAREEQSKMESRILELQGILKSAEIVKPHSSTSVELGSYVYVTKKGSSKKIEYEIVGQEDMDIPAGKIAFDSPLGSAILGKKVGDSFDFKKPNGEISYFKISKIK